MDKIPKIGHVIEEEAYRDAVHIAVAPVIAGERLAPGDRVGFSGPSYTVGKLTNKIIGIVDPYLPVDVRKGQQFYLFLMPNTITSLRHEWTHPEFAAEEEHALVFPTIEKLSGPSKAEQWIRNYADENDMDYDELMSRAYDYLDSGEYWSEGDRFISTDLPALFWDHYETVTNSHVPEQERGTFFSCSC